MLPPNENGRGADRAIGITVQKEEVGGETGRAINTEEDETVTGAIHWMMLLNLQVSLVNLLSRGTLSVSIRRLYVPVKDFTPRWHLLSPRPLPIRALLAQGESRLLVLQLATEWLPRL